MKPVYCCGACSKLMRKYNYHGKIYTFEDNKKCTAMGRPYLTIGHQLKKGG